MYARVRAIAITEAIAGGGLNWDELYSRVEAKSPGASPDVIKTAVNFVMVRRSLNRTLGRPWPGRKAAGE